MKKILSALTALSIFSSASSVLVSCDNISYWTNFINAVNNKETFVYLLSAEDCPNCNDSKDTLSYLYDKKELVKDHNEGATNNLQNIFLTTTQSSTNLNTYAKTGSDVYKAVFNSSLMDTSHGSFIDSKSQTNMWSLKWAKKIENWVVDQVRMAFKTDTKINKAITTKSLDIERTPTYIYILQGKFEGFTLGKIGDVGQIDPDTYIKNMLTNMIDESWRDTLPDEINQNNNK